VGLLGFPFRAQSAGHRQGRAAAEGEPSAGGGKAAAPHADRGQSVSGAARFLRCGGRPGREDRRPQGGRRRSRDPHLGLFHPSIDPKGIRPF